VVLFELIVYKLSTAIYTNGSAHVCAGRKRYANKRRVRQCRNSKKKAIKEDSFGKNQGKVDILSEVNYIWRQLVVCVSDSFHDLKMVLSCSAGTI
jgi:hypothetical protein